MVFKKRPKIEKRLTDVELELMNIIWDLGECSVKDVQTALPEERDLAYTSVATIVKILEQKKFLESKRVEKAHSYTAIVSREDYEAATLRHVTENIFKGSPSSMAMRLLSETDLSKEELKAIQELVKERLRS